MGCGISRFDNINAEGSSAAPPRYLLSPIHPRTVRRAVVDSSLFSEPIMPAADHQDQHAKADIQHNNKRANSERDQEAGDKEVSAEEEAEEEEYDRGHGVEYPRSLSFRIYLPKADVEVEQPSYDLQHFSCPTPTGHTNSASEHIIKDEQQDESDIENSKKGLRNRSRRRSRIGKRIKTGSAKVKSILRV